MSDIQNIVEQISSLTVLEAAKLSELLQEKLGVSPASFAPAPSPSSAPAEAVAEKSEFAVQLVSAGSNKINTIKIVREITNLGLKEAKELVDSTSEGPKNLKEGISKTDADTLLKKFEGTDAVVKLV